MKVLLLNDVAGCGRRFEVREVSPGFARNYLLPRGLAEPADDSVLKRIEKLREQVEVRQAKDLAELRQLLSQLSGVVIMIKAKANSKGGLFEGLDQKILAQAIKKETRVAIKPSWLELEHPLKETGEYVVLVKPSLPGGKSENLPTELRVKVEAL